MAEGKKTRKPKTEPTVASEELSLDLNPTGLYKVEGVKGKYLTAGKVYSVSGSVALQLIKTGQGKLV